MPCTGRAQRRGDLHQHLVARRMAMGVVDRLEVVDVEQRQAGRSTRRRRLLQRRDQCAPVGQAGQRVQPGLFVEVGVGQFQRIAELHQLFFVPGTLLQLQAQRAARPSQFQQRRHLPRQRLQRRLLLRFQRARFAIHDAEGADRQSVGIEQRRARVEADAGCAGDVRVVAEARVRARVRHHHGFVGLQDGVRAERGIARRLRILDAQPGLEPLAVGVDQRHRRHQHPADRGGDRDQVVEGGLRRGIQDVVTLQRAQALGFVVGLGGAQHGGRRAGKRAA